MNTKIEGILLSKVAHGERNLLVKLLLRSGKTISVMFYGGRGGGEKKKSSILELGTMLKVELARSNSNSEVYSAKEWQSLWMANKVRDDHLAFYVLCFIVQLAAKIAVDENLHDDSHSFDDHSHGIFRAVSNALVHLESSVANKQFLARGEIAIYLGKLLIELGVFPNIKNCMVCGINLELFENLTLSADQGGFICSTCKPSEQKGPILWSLMNDVANKKTPDIACDPNFTRPNLERLWQYFCFQFHLNPMDFKTLSMIP